MKCLYCDGGTDVINSRLQKQSNAVWRRRRCKKCKDVFTTIESISLEQALLFELSGANLTPFNRDNLFISIFECLRHRDSQISDATHLTNTIISKLLLLKSASIKRSDVIRASTEVLCHFDKAACVQYTALHKTSD